jgi:hypothetical protein
MPLLWISRDEAVALRPLRRPTLRFAPAARELRAAFLPLAHRPAALVATLGASQSPTPVRRADFVNGGKSPDAADVLQNRGSPDSYSPGEASGSE